MRVLIVCEFTGIERDAFISRGFDAWSCDLDPSERPGPHVQGDVLKILDDNWDLMIAHPPCTHLAVSGARYFKNKFWQQIEALKFVLALMNAPIPHIAIENPVSIISSEIRRPDQIIQPTQFSMSDLKTTCLWLKNLPLLKPTHLVEPKTHLTHSMTPSPTRGKDRSRAYVGIAFAMADQWGNYILLNK